MEKVPILFIFTFRKIIHYDKTFLNYSRYDKTIDSKIEIDEGKLQAAAQYDGFFGIQTNCENPNPAEILDTYRGLWQVEQTFRIAKSTLEIRPVYHYLPRRIRAHG